MAKELGIPNVDGMLAGISGRTFAEWMAYASLEPFGEERADLRSAMLMALTANVHRDGRKRPKPFEVSDFMPKFEKPEPMPREEAIAAIEAMMMEFVKATERRQNA